MTAGERREFRLNPEGLKVGDRVVLHNPDRMSVSAGLEVGMTGRLSGR